MTTPGSPPAAAPVVDREDEAGAPASPPPGCDPVSAPSDERRALIMLGALIAVWRDLSVDVRRRIAADAMAAMGRAERCDDPPGSTALPEAAQPRRDADRRHADAQHDARVR